MTSRACVQLPLYSNGIGVIIDSQITNTPHGILVHLAALENGINSDIDSLKYIYGVYF